MSYQKGDKDFAEQPKAHKIRITLTSRKVQSLERVCTELIERARSKDLPVKGPVRLPVRPFLPFALTMRIWSNNLVFPITDQEP